MTVDFACSAADPTHFAEILNPTFTRVTELHLLKGFRHFREHIHFILSLCRVSEPSQAQIDR
jgi:hypothetical protein